MSAVRLVILGRQGAGKGTQAKRLAERYEIPHISTGDMLREAVREGTEFGRRAAEVMERGELVSDEIMAGIVSERLAEDDARDGYILDGFPRTLAQAETLERITVDRPLDMVLNLEVAEERVIERITGRRVCSTCGAIYSVASPPKENWTCDVDGGEVVQRRDDTEEAVRKRLELYAAETLPLVPFYEERGLLVTVDGIGDPDEVEERNVDAIENRRRG